jgi:hypothetical protein
MKGEPILQMWSDKMTPRNAYEKSFKIRFPDRGEWNKGFQPDKKGRLTWYTGGSKTEKGNGAGGKCHETRKKLTFPLESTQQYPGRSRWH